MAFDKADNVYTIYVTSINNKPILIYNVQVYELFDKHMLFVTIKCFHKDLPLTFISLGYLFK